MPKTRVTIDVPDVEQLTAQLSLGECHPPLTEAEQAVATAETCLAEAQAAIVDEQAAVAGQRATGAGIDELADALRRVQAAQMIASQCGEDLTAAREHVEDELSAARRAMGAAIDERTGQLQAVADELAPVLEALCDRVATLNEHVARQRCGLTVSEDVVRWRPSPGMKGFIPAAWREKKAS